MTVFRQTPTKGIVARQREDQARTWTWGVLGFRHSSPTLELRDWTTIVPMALLIHTPHIGNTWNKDKAAAQYNPCSYPVTWESYRLSTR
jgi:hypothetical protein